MKSFAAVLAAAAILVSAYAASAVYSLRELAEAARTANGARLTRLTDVPRVRHSLVDQIISGYLQKIGQKREVKPFERMAVETFGASIADELAIKLTTPENLSAILGAGAIRDATSNIEVGMPALTSLDFSRPSGVLVRFHPVKPVEFSLLLGTHPSDGSISMHFDGPGWKLSGINLPAAAVRALVDRLPSR